MNVAGSGGMRLKASNGMELKMPHGMQIQASNGMELKASKGMGLRADNNYIKFNEYERARKYLQMGSHIARARTQKPQAQTVKAVAIPVTPKTKFHPRKKWRQVVILLFAVSAFQKASARGKYRLQHFPMSAYNSRGTMVRTFSVFQQLLNV